MRFLKRITALLFMYSCALHASQDDLRDQISKALATTNTKQFAFEQEKHMAMLQKPLITQGQLHLEKQNQIIWDIQKPYVIRYIVSSDSVREIGDNGEHEMRLRDNPLAASLGQAIRAALSGDWSTQADQVNITSQGSIAKWQLNIVPTSENLHKLIATLQVEGAQGIIQTISIVETNGDSTIIHLKAQSDVH